jgi:hypothetical protein
MEVDWSVAGRFMPKIILTSEGAPDEAGEFFRDVRHGTREFLMPFDIEGATEAELRTNVRRIVASMDPTRGVGRWRVTSPVGDQREIRCYNASGLEGQETLGELSGPQWQRFPATFIALTPYWYDVSPTTQTFTVAVDTPSFFPFFPMSVTASELAIDTYVDNTGDVKTWPVWTITGPGSVIKLSNLTTGRFISFPTGSLGPGQSLYIDTSPGVKSVKYEDGSSAYAAMSSDSFLWPLERGINIIRLEMSGADNTVSKMDLTYWKRYLSA